jgi:hypothetical protein
MPPARKLNGESARVNFPQAGENTAIIGVHALAAMKGMPESHCPAVDSRIKAAVTASSRPS